MAKVLGLYKVFGYSEGSISHREILIYFVSLILISSGFFLSSGVLQNLAAFLYTIICTFLIYYFFNKEINIKPLLITIPISINLIFLISKYIFVKDQAYFANFDTLNNFYPKAELIAEKLFGTAVFTMPKNWNDKFLLFDFINAFFIQLFGRSEIIFMLLLAIYKASASLFIFQATKKIFNEDHAKLAALLYLLNPIYIMHSAFIFKESWIQMLFASFVYLIILFYQKPSNTKILVLSGIVGLICVWERIYLLIPVTLTLALVMLFSFKQINKFVSILIILILATIVCFLTKLLSSIDQLITYLMNTRAFYATYSDVDSKVNYDIGYLLGFVKLLFSPYPNLRKLELFNGVSLLIFWSSLVSHLLTIGMFIGMYKSKIGKLKIAFLISFIGFVGFLSFIAPYGFRQRDSMAILYVMFSAYCFLPYLKLVQVKLKTIPLDKYPIFYFFRNQKTNILEQ